MKSKKFLNLKVGVEFYETLMSRPAFQKNWKAVSPSFYLVNRIAKLSEMEHGEAVEFWSGTITVCKIRSNLLPRRSRRWTLASMRTTFGLDFTSLNSIKKCFLARKLLVER